MIMLLKGKISKTLYMSKTCQVLVQVGDTFTTYHTKKLLKVI